MRSQRPTGASLAALLAVNVTSLSACEGRVSLGGWTDQAPLEATSSPPETTQTSTEPPSAPSTSVGDEEAAGPSPLTDAGAQVSPTPDAGSVVAPVPVIADAGPPQSPASDAGNTSAPMPTEELSCGLPDPSGPPNAAGPEPGATDIVTDWIRTGESEGIQWDLLVEQDVSPRAATSAATSGYYWSHQFDFAGGVRGVAGLQSEGWYDVTAEGISEFTKIAVFWLSGPPIDAELGEIPYPDARVAPKRATGVDWLTIHARFEWQACHLYRFTVAPDEVTADGDIWYGGWIEDVTDGELTLLGRMLLPSDTGLISPISLSRTSPIDFPGFVDCVTPEHVSAVLSAPVSAENPASPANLITNRYRVPARCATSRFTPLTGAVRHELGVVD